MVSSNSSSLGLYMAHPHSNHLTNTMSNNRREAIDVVPHRITPKVIPFVPANLLTQDFPSHKRGKAELLSVAIFSPQHWSCILLPRWLLADQADGLPAT